MYLTDYHIHSSFSIDGYETVDFICETAIEKGFSEIALTDHFDPWAKDEHCEKTYPAEEIKAAVFAAREKYAGKIKLLYGVEAGQGQIYPQSVTRLLKNDYDYVIGSVHNIDGDVDLAMVEYTKESCKTYMQEYFSGLVRMARQGMYDCLGHLDYPKRYAAKAGFGFDLADYREIIEGVLKDVIAMGKGIEVNCSGLRQAIGETMPGFEVIRLYRALGGEIITVGSDAHKGADIGEKIIEGIELIKQAGFRYITTFEKRKPSFVKL